MHNRRPQLPDHDTLTRTMNIDELTPSQKAGLLYMINPSNWRRLYGKAVPPSPLSLSRKLGHKSHTYAYELVKMYVSEGFLEPETLRPTSKCADLKRTFK